MQQERREASIWSGKVFSSGWVEARGGVCDVTDPSICLALRALQMVRMSPLLRRQPGELKRGGLQYPSVKEPRLYERLRKN